MATAFSIALTNACLAQTLTTIYEMPAGVGHFAHGDLLLMGDKLYGTTASGGASYAGTIYVIGTNGAGYKTLHSFTNVDYTNSDGAEPYCALVSSGTALYGTTIAGGTYGSGTVFMLNTNGTGFATLHRFVG
jgi:uncharacterized repeat protein (TIGR03803 family)